MAKHPVEVIKIDSFVNHPDPETTKLGIVQVHGFTVIVNKETFKPGLFCYIEPDSIVDTHREEFAFLHKERQYERIRVKRLRGVYSQGLLIPSTNGFKEGDDVAEYLNVQHYEPPLNLRDGNNIAAPEIFAPIYDMENYNRYLDCFVENEEVVACEKIHGANARFACINDELYTGSRTSWKKEDISCAWWVGLKNHPAITEFLKNHQNIVLYGEIYGNVQSLKYGIQNNINVVLFDMLRGNEWISWNESQELARNWNLPWVPIVYKGEFKEKTLRELAEGDSILAKQNGVKHIREGIVIKPIKERTNITLGRVQLKMISNAYLEKN